MGARHAHIFDVQKLLLSNVNSFPISYTIDLIFH